MKAILIAMMILPSVCYAQLPAHSIRLNRYVWGNKQPAAQPAKDTIFSGYFKPCATPYKSDTAIVYFGSFSANKFGSEYYTFGKNR